jgi:hypothetical protein
MAQVKFIYTDAAKYGASAKDAGTLYFLSDTKQIFKGAERFSGLVCQEVTADPALESAEVNTLYINTTDGSVKIYNGTNLTTIVDGYVTAITGNGSATDRVSSKAVVDYVGSKIGDLDVGKLSERVKTNEDNIATLKGDASTAGSVAKAVADAKTELTAEIDKKATKATTLEGYGITNAYTQTQVDTAISTAKSEVVNDLTEGNGITITGTKANKTIAAKVDPAEGNALTVGEAGLKVTIPAAAEYSVVKDEASDAYAAVYHLTKGGVNVGAAINIPKDMVVKSGSVVTNPTGQTKGTYIELVLANATSDKIYIPVDQLIEYVTSGSAKSDPIVVAVSADHKVTATITDGSITKAKLAAAVQTSLGKADSAVQTVATGTTNGTISVDGTEVPVAGLGSAAYTSSTDYIPATKLGEIGEKTIKGYVDDKVGGQDFSGFVKGTEIKTGTANGTIAVKGTNVAVKGLDTAAYAKATDFATAAQGTKADTAVQSVVTGTANGTILVDNVAVAVHGLGSAAYTDSTAYDKNGDAATALTNAKAYTDAALIWGTLS